MPLALVKNLANMKCNQHWFQFWPPCGDICFSYKFGHQMAPLALVANLATRWRHLHKLQVAPSGDQICNFMQVVPPGG